jgi:hypothetical protein
MGKKKMVSGIIYKAKKGHIYDPDNKKYDCFSPASYADGCKNIGDCLVCDEKGNMHPGYVTHPVPVHVDVLGSPVGTFLCGDDPIAITATLSELCIILNLMEKIEKAQNSKNYIKAHNLITQITKILA